MAKNLYICSFDDLTYADMTAFLAIEDSEGLRPAEGPRLDYKRDIPRDLDKSVAAMANGQGGLLFLGIDESDGRPTKIVGLPSGRSDLKTQLGQSIEGTIEPPPDFEIAVLPDPLVPNRNVAIIRVEPSVWPPHLLTRTGSIPVRRQDRTVAATIRDIEDLMDARRRPSTTPDRFQFPGLVVKRRNAENPGRPNSSTFLCIWLEPERAIKLRLHRPQEHELAEIVRVHFPEALEYGARDREWFDLVDDPERIDFYRTWRLKSSGGFAFATQVQRAATGLSGSGHVHLVDVARDTLRALATGRLLFEHLGIGGRWRGGVHLMLDTAPVTTTDQGGETVLKGVMQVSSVRNGGAGPVLIAHDTTELQSPASIVAQALSAHLRQQRSADVDLDEFEVELDDLGRQIGVV